MKTLVKIALVGTTLLSLNAAETTILEVSKNVNPLNVLHYKVKYDQDTCEITGKVFAEWKMGEERGQWKPLSESPGMIRRPLLPTTTQMAGHEAIFVTKSMSDFAKKGILDNQQVTVRTERDDSGACRVYNQIPIKGKDINVERLHSKISIFGKVKGVTIHGHDANKKRVQMTF